MLESRVYIENLQIRPRTLARYPFDYIALSMISKAFSLSESCLILISAKHVDEAFGLTRSLVESALILRFITTNEETIDAESRSFVEFSKVYQDYWFHHARKNVSGTIDQAEMDRYASMFNPRGDPNPALKGWSKRRFSTYRTQHVVHPLDDAWVTKDVKSVAYAVDYFQTSQSVHCSQPALDNFFPDEYVPFTIKASDERFHASITNVHFKLLVYLHQLIRYALYGMKVSGGELLDELLRRELRLVQAAAVAAYLAMPELHGELGGGVVGGGFGVGG